MYASGTAVDLERKEDEAAHLAEGDGGRWGAAARTAKPQFGPRHSTRQANEAVRMKLQMRLKPMGAET